MHRSDSLQSMDNPYELNPLTAISPLDGRYWQKIGHISQYFSEFSLIKYRVKVEVEYFITLCEIPLPQLEDFEKSRFETMRKWYNEFSLEEANKIKDIEKITNHDVKAVEYYIRKKFDEFGWDSKHKEFIHFGLTSNDVNNTAIPMLLKEGIERSYLPTVKEVLSKLESQANDWIDVPMLARTHGQPATPTRVGKELMVFVERIQDELRLLTQIPYRAKFGGATGQLNAHKVAYPSLDWISISNKYIKRLGLEREQFTTQIAHYDSIAALCDSLKRINNIWVNLCRDLWLYISMDYFKQKINNEEVGSSAMPHKVNPIDFENAEGNFGIANALYDHLSSKLPISRLQRDLTDSTVLRNLGVPFAHSVLGFNSLQRGLGKIIINHNRIHQDLEDNWVVVSEALQTVLRREGYPDPYEALKKLTRTGVKINQQAILNFVQTLNVSEDVKEELMNITPFNYTGVVPDTQQQNH